MPPLRPDLSESRHNSPKVLSPPSVAPVCRRVTLAESDSRTRGKDILKNEHLARLWFEEVRKAIRLGLARKGLNDQRESV